MIDVFSAASAFRYDQNVNVVLYFDLKAANTYKCIVVHVSKCRRLFTTHELLLLITSVFVSWSKSLNLIWFPLFKIIISMKIKFNEMIFTFHGKKEINCFVVYSKVYYIQNTLYTAAQCCVQLNVELSFCCSTIGYLFEPEKIFFELKITSKILWMYCTWTDMCVSNKS